MTLAEVKNTNSKAIISDFQGESLLIERLKEMGLYQGLEIELVGHAPFGGPMLFQFGNTVLALRNEEALCVKIQN